MTSVDYEEIMNDYEWLSTHIPRLIDVYDDFDVRTRMPSGDDLRIFGIEDLPITADEAVEYANKTMFYDLDHAAKNDKGLFDVLTDKEYAKASDIEKERQDFLRGYNDLIETMTEFWELVDNMGEDDYPSSDYHHSSYPAARTDFVYKVEELAHYLGEFFNLVKPPVEE